MVDINKIVSFDPPAWYAKQGHNPSVANITNANTRRLIMRGMQELATTPEGQKLIKDATAKSPDGKLHFINAKAIPFNQFHEKTAARAPDTIQVGNDGATDYLGPNGQRHKISIQRMLHHELRHLAYGDSEPQAVRNTNPYMKKYYGEVERNPNTARPYTLSKPGNWTRNRNFRPFGQKSDLTDPAAIKTRLAGLTPEQARAMGPEIDSLYQLRQFPDRFNAQIAELREHGGLDTATAKLSTLRPDASTQSAALKPALSHNTGGALTLG